MKTNSSARWIARIPVTLLCLALVSIAGVEFGFSRSLASQFGQTTVSHTDSPQAPGVGLADLMAAAR